MSYQMKIIQVPISLIKIGDRHRKDMGDIKSLADSISNLGLLQPIGIRPDKSLVCGQRRIKAVESIGWDHISAVVLENLEDEIRLEQAEIEENICRKDLLPSEAVARAKLILPRLEEEAKKRMAEGGGDQKSASKSGRENFPTRSNADDGKVMQQAAKVVGMSAPTLRKAIHVTNESSKPDAPTEIKEAAKRMDETGKIDPAYKVVKEITNKNKESKPTISRAVLWSKKMEEITEIVRGIDHQYGSVSKMLKSDLWSSSTPQEKKRCIRDTIMAAEELTSLSNSMKKHLGETK